MVNRCVAGGCSNTPSPGVSLYKILLFENSGKSKSKERERSGRLRKARFSAVSILPKIVSR